jgi:hypothetical protein
MRNVGKAPPEWGYLTPEPSFMHRVRIALIATATGAIAGASVVASLIENPTTNSGNTSPAAHALVASAPVIAPPPPPESIGLVQAVPAKPTTASAEKVAPADAGASTAGAIAHARRSNRTMSPTSASATSAGASAEIPLRAEAPAAAADTRPKAAPVVAPTPENPTEKRRLAKSEARKRWHYRQYRRLFDEYDGRRRRRDSSIHDEW